MTRPRLLFLVVPLVTALAAAPSCSSSESGGPRSTSASSGGHPSSSGSGSGGTCAALPVSEAFSVCDGRQAPDGGPGAAGAACSSDADCGFVCCPCPEGQNIYAYAACSCGRCTSVCDPANDYRAPVCLDAGPVTTGCWRCSQILNEALAEGMEFGSLACQGAAANAWNELAACASGACGGACDGGVMPDNACVLCVEAADDAGGCGTEFGSCESH